MTIARRLIILAAVPLMVLLGLGFLSWNQLARVETRTRYAELQVQSLAALGNISRQLTEMRVSVRSYLLARDSGERSNAKAALDESKAALARLLQNYGDELISDARDQRMLSDFRALNDEWSDAAEKIISLATNGHREEAVALLHGSFAEVGARLNTASREWIQHNEQLAEDAGKAALGTIAESRRNLIIAGVIALTLSGWLGFVSFLRIVKPIQALESSVKSIAAGDYAKEVPFTAARDETGGLARSVDVLKQGAAAMDEQRWVKASAAKLTGALQGAASLAEFGQRFLSGLVPLLGGGVAGFYLFDEKAGRLQRIASTGWRKLQHPRTLWPGRRTGRAVRARAPAGHAHEPAGGLSAHRLGFGRSCAGPGHGISAVVLRTLWWRCWRLPVSTFSARARKRYSRNCCRWWR